MKVSRTTKRLALAFTLLLALFVVDSAQACPTCKESLSENNKELVQGYFWSIMFMMAMPFSILTGIGTYFYVLIRKSKKNGEKIGSDKLTEAESLSAVVEEA